MKGPYEIKLCYCIKKQDPKRKIGFLIFYLPHFSLKKFLDPFISQKKNSSDYRLHGTQNDRLELTVSTQKSVLKNMHWGLRYWPKRAQIEVAKPNLHILRHFGQYLRTRYVFFKTDFCIETVGSSRSFWVPWSLKRNKFFLPYKGVQANLWAKIK